MGPDFLVFHMSTLRQSFSYCSGPFWSTHLFHSPHLPPSMIGHNFRKIEPGKSLLVVLAALKPPILCSALWQESYIWLASAMELVLIHLWRKEFRTTFFFTVIRKEKWLESDTSLEVNDLMTFFRDKKNGNIISSTRVHSRGRKWVLCHNKVFALGVFLLPCRLTQFLI